MPEQVRSPSESPEMSPSRRGLQGGHPHMYLHGMPGMAPHHQEHGHSHMLSLADFHDQHPMNPFLDHHPDPLFGVRQTFLIAARGCCCYPLSVPVFLILNLYPLQSMLAALLKGASSQLQQPHPASLFGQAW